MSVDKILINDTGDIQHAHTSLINDNSVESTELTELCESFSNIAASDCSTALCSDGNLEETESVVFATEKELMEQYNFEMEVRKLLNQQTLVQFTLHAEETHPKDPTKQQELISQLQEQYFHQYLTEVHVNQLNMQKEQFEQLKQIAKENGTEFKEDDYEMPPLIPASLWTRKDIVDFKKEILRDSKQCCIKIKSLETATIRVPTSPNGKCMFWEFATDSYDLGFGVYFEWCLDPSDKVTVNISESDDEEDEYMDEDGGPIDESTGDQSGSGDATNRNNEYLNTTDDVEGRIGSSNRIDNRPPTDELIPVYRRDCHLEVFCGSHRYPGQGYYVLKFDNSFSLWRSKWLYYRVFYTS